MEEHQYALNTDGNWTDARTTPYIRNAVYFCGCPQRHRLKHVKPKQRTHYFAHIVSGNKRPWEVSRCGAGGESIQHRLAKHKLRECINALSFAMTKCAGCGKQTVIHFTGCIVRLEIRSDDGKWRYDCLVYDSEGTKFFALEIAHTHFTGQDKATSTNRDGLCIAEFLAEDVMNMDASNGRLRNLLMTVEICNPCKLNHERTIELEAEIAAWLELDAVCMNRFMLEDHNRLFDRKLSSISKMERALMILEHYEAQITLRPSRPQWNEITLSKRMRRFANGFRLDVSGTNIPSDFMFFLVVDRSWESNGRILSELKHIWQNFSICRDFVATVTLDFVLAQLSTLRQGKHIVAKSSLWPMLKQIETNSQICAACGIYGHKSEHCGHRFCANCGRGGHTARSCYARTTVNGKQISSF